MLKVAYGVATHPPSITATSSVRCSGVCRCSNTVATRPSVDVCFFTRKCWSA